MARAVVLARTHFAPLPAFEIIRAATVAACALALILAGQPLPF